MMPAAELTADLAAPNHQTYAAVGRSSSSVILNTLLEYKTRHDPTP